MRISFKNSKAFTLAEIMIVLTVIGILTAILMPIAIQSAPDENVMKFKKANATLGTVIRELVNSDRYYLDGDLGTRADGTVIDGTHAGDVTYFCQTLSEVLNTKKVACSSANCTGDGCAFVQFGTKSGNNYGSITSAKERVDSVCNSQASRIGAEITTADNVVFYQTSATNPFGVPWSSNTSHRLFSSPYGPIAHDDDNGFDRVYKTFCIDVDGIDNGEAPFGYGIRADGKILTGARADEWIEKSIQRGNE